MTEDSENDLSKLSQEKEQSEERLRAIFDLAVDGIIMINDRGHIQKINPAVIKQFGYSYEELIGENISILMPEPDHSRHDQYMANYHQTGVGKIIGIGRKVRGKRKDGSTFPFLLSISEMKLANERYYTGMIHDITALDKAEKELNELNENLEERIAKRTQELDQAFGDLKLTNEALNAEVKKRRETEEEMKKLLKKEMELSALKSRFVSMASHEFRTPLSGILSSASLISKYQETEQDEKRQKHIDRIRTSVHNLTNILNDFLSLDKLQSGKVSLHSSTFSILDLIEEIKGELDSTLTAGRSFSSQHNGSISEVNLDRNILKNVLLNLISNAVKYSHDKTKIEIYSEINAFELLLRVKDQGIGIPKADQQHLFERFFRAANATNIKGTGLGLNIVKRYLDLVDGHISYESEEGVGTTFEVSIPLIDQTKRGS